MKKLDQFAAPQTVTNDTQITEVKFYKVPKARIGKINHKPSLEIKHPNKPYYNLYLRSSNLDNHCLDDYVFSVVNHINEQLLGVLKLGYSIAPNRIGSCWALETTQINLQGDTTPLHRVYLIEALAGKRFNLYQFYYVKTVKLYR